MKKLLIIIEDDLSSSILLKHGVGRPLEKEGYETVVCEGYADIRKLFPNGFPKHSLILTDGNVKDGKMTDHLNLFTKEDKQRTVVTSQDDDLKAIFAANGFPFFRNKHDVLSIRSLIQERVTLAAA